MRRETDGGNLSDGVDFRDLAERALRGENPIGIAGGETVVMPWIHSPLGIDDQSPLDPLCRYYESVAAQTRYGQALREGIAACRDSSEASVRELAREFCQRYARDFRPVEPTSPTPPERVPPTPPPPHRGPYLPIRECGRCAKLGGHLWDDELPSLDGFVPLTCEEGAARDQRRMLKCPDCGTYYLHHHETPDNDPNWRDHVYLTRITLEDALRHLAPDYAGERDEIARRIRGSALEGL